MSRAAGMRQRHNQKKGFNLIEAAIVLGVVGLVIGGIWVAAAAVKDRFEEKHFYEQISHVVRVAQKLLPQSIPLACGGYLQDLIGWQNDNRLGIYPPDPFVWWGTPDILIPCDANGNKYLELRWWAYDDFDRYSRGDCQRIKNFMTRAFGRDLVEVQDCDTPWWTTISFGVALPRINN